MCDGHMNIYKCDTPMKIKDAPIGLFELEDSGELIVISEYHENNRRLAIIVSSGEYYCGGDELTGHAIILD